MSFVSVLRFNLFLPGGVFHLGVALCSMCTVLLLEVFQALWVVLTYFVVVTQRARYLSDVKINNVIWATVDINTTFSH